MIVMVFTYQTKCHDVNAGITSAIAGLLAHSDLEARILSRSVDATAAARSPKSVIVN